MAYFIRLERKEDVEWLASLLGNSVERLREGGLQSVSSAADKIYRIHDAIINAVPAKEAEALGITSEEYPEDVKPAKTTRIKPKDDYIPNLCESHPRNEFKRSPRTDCEGCWAAYKRLHPMEYDNARRKFDRKK